MNQNTKAFLLTVMRLYAFFQVVILSSCTWILDFSCPVIPLGTTDPDFAGQTQWSNEDIVLVISADRMKDDCEDVHVLRGFAYNNNQSAQWSRLSLTGKVKEIGRAESEVWLYGGGNDAFTVLTNVEFKRTGNVLSFVLEYNRNGQHEEHYELDRQTLE